MFYLAIAVALLALSIFTGAIMAKASLNEAAARVSISASALLAACGQLVTKFGELTNELRAIADNAKATTGDDAAIQLNATADRLDQEVSAISAALALPSADSSTGSVVTSDGPAPITLAGDGLPDGVAGAGYSGSLSASGGDGGPYSFACLNPPPGVSVNSTGGVSGTPAEAGNYVFTVTATDPAGASGASDFTLHVAAAG